MVEIYYIKGDHGRLIIMNNFLNKILSLNNGLSCSIEVIGIHGLWECSFYKEEKGFSYRTRIEKSIQYY